MANLARKHLRVIPNRPPRAHSHIKGRSLNELKAAVRRRIRLEYYVGEGDVVSPIQMKPIIATVAVVTLAALAIGCLLVVAGAQYVNPESAWMSMVYAEVAIAVCLLLALLISSFGHRIDF